MTIIVPNYAVEFKHLENIIFKYQKDYKTQVNLKQKTRFATK